MQYMLSSSGIPKSIKTCEIRFKVKPIYKSSPLLINIVYKKYGGQLKHTTPKFNNNANLEQRSSPF